MANSHKLVSATDAHAPATHASTHENGGTDEIDVTGLTGVGAPTNADYLVGTSNAGLSAEIVVGTSPGGELGGTWASPTVDSTHAGSTHSAATDTHIADTTDAHDASAVSFDATGLTQTSATEVQTAIEDLDAAIDGLGGGSGNLAGTELDYVEFTSPVTVSATSEASPTNVVVGNSVAYDGSTVILIEFFAPWANDAGTGDFLELFLYDGTTSLGAIWQTELLGSDILTQASGKRRLTPSNASHTYKIGGIRGSGNGTVTAGAGGSGNVVPGFLRITRVSA